MTVCLLPEDTGIKVLHTIYEACLPHVHLINGNSRIICRLNGPSLKWYLTWNVLSADSSSVHGSQTTLSRACKSMHNIEGQCLLVTKFVVD